MLQPSSLLSVSNGEITVKLDLIHIKKSAAILRALNHKLRQQILNLLDESTKMTVTELYVKLRIEQSVVSQHLAILRRANIVHTKREGKYIFYTINYLRVSEVNKFIREFLGQ
jgi:DNA-binding transcriptional ArsR family regulator